MGVFVGEQEMTLMTLATGVRFTMLTDNLGIPFTLVLLKANEAFHGVLYPLARGRINFIISLRRAF